jgi:hypothetical protein
LEEQEELIQDEIEQEADAKETTGSVTKVKDDQNLDDKMEAKPSAEAEQAEAVSDANEAESITEADEAKKDEESLDRSVKAEDTKDEKLRP